MEILKRVLESYSIDRKRILVTGYSLGGHGTWYMAARHPDFFRAAIPMAGSPGEESLEHLEMPICIVHSMDDRVVSIGPARDAVKALKSRGARAELIVARGVGHYQFSEFIPYLRRAAKWIKKQWNEDSQ
jgi:predicted peptidase